MTLRRGIAPLLTLLAACQTVAAFHVLATFASTARRAATRDERELSVSLTAVVPTLNEAERLLPCLRALTAALEVERIIVADTGSTDGTVELAHGWPEARVSVLEAGAPPSWWPNGKAWGLHLASLDVATPWVLFVDADVQVSARAIQALTAAAMSEGLDLVSAAPRQRARGVHAAVHASLLATLIYRTGIPGRPANRRATVVANGQCMLVRAEALWAVGGWRLTSRSPCEDVTLARLLWETGFRVGFIETPDAEATMYRGAKEAWQNWPRSLALRDRLTRPAPWLGLATVTFAQALPLPGFLVGLLCRAPRWWLLVQGALAAFRLAVGAGMRRAYLRPGPWYWIALIVDMPVALRLWYAAFVRRHRWRGRTLRVGAFP